MMRSVISRHLAKISLIVLTGMLFFSPVLAAQQEFTLKIVQRQIAKKPPTIKVKQGDRLVLNWTTDEAVKLHLHGYDLLLTLRSGNVSQAPQKMMLTANIAGRFPLSAHGFGADLGTHAKHQKEAPLLYLEVEPQ
jgi:hypothetical protein